MKIKRLFATLAVFVLMIACTFSMTAFIASAAEATPTYTFTEEDISYVLELTDEDDFKLTANNKGSEATITGTYTIEEDVITLVIAGEEFAQFKLNEDMTMDLVVEEENTTTDSNGITINVPSNVEDYKAQIEELTALIEQLHSELNKEEVNYEEVGKIAVAILGVVGMIILGLLFVIVRLKIKNINKDKLYQDVREQTDKIFADYQKEVKGLIEDVKSSVTKKIDETEEKRQAEAEAQSIKLRASVEAAKANLSINSVLDD